jgi:hypothetical protein
MEGNVAEVVQVYHFCHSYIEVDMQDMVGHIEKVEVHLVAILALLEPDTVVQPTLLIDLEGLNQNLVQCLVEVGQ